MEQIPSPYTKENVMRLLHCFLDNEGTLFENSWKSWGIPEQDGEKISKDFDEFLKDQGE